VARRLNMPRDLSTLTRRFGTSKHSPMVGAPGPTPQRRTPGARPARRARALDSVQVNSAAVTRNQALARTVRSHAVA